MKFDKPHFEFNRRGYLWTPFMDFYWGKSSNHFPMKIYFKNHSFGLGKCKK